jgi:hypothetical protein
MQTPAHKTDILYPTEGGGPGPRFEHLMLVATSAHDGWHARIDHERATLHDFDILASEHPNRCEGDRDLISVGLYGESRWMKAEEVLELAALLRHVAHAQIDRVFRERHRIFLINHPGGAASNDEGGAA